jgi:hypothetical protein
MSTNCENGRYLHFTISFYADAAQTNLVKEVLTKRYWQYFTVDGAPMGPLGAFVCECECVNIEFQLPLNPPAELSVLFNQKLYVKIGKPTINYSDESHTPGDPIPKAQIIFLVDESGSMNTEHAWIPNIVRKIEALLVAENVGPSDYGMLGFGGPNHGDPRLFPLSTAGHAYPFGSAEALATLVESGVLVTSGGTEDGYEAIAFGFAQFGAVLDPAASICFVLITDEDRDDTTADTYASIKQLILDNNAKLFAVVNADLRDSDGNPAIGIVVDPDTSEKKSYILDGSSFEIVPGGSAYSGAGTTLVDYFNLAMDVNSSAWDLNFLRNGGVAGDAFSDAFASAISDTIVVTFNCIVQDTPSPIQDFFCFREENDPGVNVTLSEIRAGCVHVLFNFFADEERQSFVTGAFSLLDQRRWFLLGTDLPPCDLQPMTPYGVLIEEDGVANVTYYPEVLPPEKIENQQEYTLKTLVKERSLICGVKYYGTIQLYYADTGEFVHYGNFVFKYNCANVPSLTWRQNWDAKNWLSSGQGKQDRKVSRTARQALFPSVSSNLSGQFAVAWQDFRNSDASNKTLSYTPQIYYSFWDMRQDIIWATGPGHYDKRLFGYGFRPEVTTDPAGIFYFASRKTNGVQAFAGPVPKVKVDASSNYLLTDDKFFNLDGVGLAEGQYLKARVLEEDAKGSFVIDSETTVAVIDDCLTRLDIVGVPGTYAVRLRNEDSDNWSDWISIDEKRPDIAAGADNTDETDNSYLRAYFVDSHRFTVPWFVSGGNGLKRVAIQVLTFYGISPTFDVNILANTVELEYSLRFYKSFGSSIFSNEVPFYNGYPVVTQNLVTSGETVTNSPVYVKVEFADKDRLKFYLTKASQFTRYSGLAKSVTPGASKLTFNVIQQGVNDQFGLELTEISEGVYKGEFVVNKSDGVFDKDGLAAIAVNIPNPCTQLRKYNLCGTDDCDQYNQMNLSILRDFYAKYDKSFKDMNPSALAEAYRKSGLAKVTAITPLKQYYTKDDQRFTFGNPKFFFNLSK